MGRLLGGDRRSRGRGRGLPRGSLRCSLGGGAEQAPRPRRGGRAPLRSTLTESIPLNWLAHLVLAGDDPAELVGNLQADFMRGVRFEDLPDEVRPGVLRHRRVDAFVDAHPAFLRSKRALPERYGLLRGVVVDVLYDHVLARDWDRLAPTPEPLDAWTRRVYATLDRERDRLRGRLRDVAPHLIAGDWLGSYRDLGAIRRALDGIGRRLKRPRRLAGAADAFGEAPERFVEDFEELFPELHRRFGARRDGAW